MNGPNVAIALQLLIDLTTQGLKLQEVLQRANSEGRDLNAAELDAASNSADLALARLKASIESMG